MGHAVTSVPFVYSSITCISQTGRVLDAKHPCTTSQRSAGVVWGWPLMSLSERHRGSQGGAVASVRETVPGGQPWIGREGHLGQQLSLSRASIAASGVWTGLAAPQAPRPISYREPLNVFLLVLWLNPDLQMFSR